MRVMIFDDKSNFDGCLSALNKLREKGDKRFWRIEKYLDFFFNKLKVLPNLNHDFELIRTYVYTGKYNSNILTSLNWACKKEIDKMNELIKNENKLLELVSKLNIEGEAKKRISEHVYNLKEVFQQIKDGHISTIEKQKRHSEGQKNMFKYLENLPFLELRTTDLKQARGIIYQKGVDVKIATDLVHYAHCNSYDIALILGGDTDLIECIRLIRKGMGKIVIVMAYYNDEPTKSCISPRLIKEADYFYNIAELSEEEIKSFSDELRLKEDKVE